MLDKGVADNGVAVDLRLMHHPRLADGGLAENAQDLIRVRGQAFGGNHQAVMQNAGIVEQMTFAAHHRRLNGDVVTYARALANLRPIDPDVIAN